MANQRHISPLLFLTPRLPGFLIGRRLNYHALELLQLDRALCRLGPHQLSDSELRQVSPTWPNMIYMMNTVYSLVSCVLDLSINLYSILYSIFLFSGLLCKGAQF